MNRQAMELPTVGDIEARLANSNVDNGGTGEGKEKEEADATYSSEGSYYSTASDDTSSDEGGKTNSKRIEVTHETKTSTKVLLGRFTIQRVYRKSQTIDILHV